MTDKKELTPQQELADVVAKIEIRKSNLKWFDYQVRGGRWDDRPQDEVRAERQEIIEDLESLSKRYSSLTECLSEAGRESKDD